MLMAWCKTAVSPMHQLWRYQSLAQSQQHSGLSYWGWYPDGHYNGIIMIMMASQITSVLIVYSTICSGEDERKHGSSASLAYVRGIHRWLVNSPHKGPVTQKMFPFDDAIMVPQASSGWLGTRLGCQRLSSWTNRILPGLVTRDWCPHITVNMGSQSSSPWLSPRLWYLLTMEIGDTAVLCCAIGLQYYSNQWK